MMMRANQMKELKGDHGSIGNRGPKDCDVRYAALNEYVQQIGCESYAMIAVPRGAKKIQNVVIYSNWPRDLLVCNIGAFLTSKTEFLDLVFNTIEPFKWTFKGVYETNWLGSENRIGRIARDSNLLDGLIVPVHGPGPNVGFLAIGGMKREPNSMEVSKLQSIAIELFSRHYADRQQRAVQKLNLTAKEIEVLRSLSMGKSIDEIGNTIGHSPIVASAYISNIKTKLNSATPIEAVISALRLGLIC